MKTCKIKLIDVWRQFLITNKYISYNLFRAYAIGLCWIEDSNTYLEIKRLLDLNDIKHSVVDKKIFKIKRIKK